MHIFKYHLRVALLFALPIILISARATAAEDTARSPSKQNTVEEDFTEDTDTFKVYDPWEPMNRGIFKFNDRVYFWVFKPIAKGYRAAVPEGGRVAISNFFSNLVSPIRIVNAALQLKGEKLGNELTRFGINSTIGLLGFFDVAQKDFRIPKSNEDFGQTLGYYGVPSGPYIVLPFLGPSSLRDGTGLFVDGKYLDPAAKNSLIFPNELDTTSEYLAEKFVVIETDISLDKDTYEAIVQESLDPYLFLRNAYIQRRNGLIKK